MATERTRVPLFRPHETDVPYDRDPRANPMVEMPGNREEALAAAERGRSAYVNLGGGSHDTTALMLEHMRQTGQITQAEYDDIKHRVVRMGGSRSDTPLDLSYRNLAQDTAAGGYLPPNLVEAQGQGFGQASLERIGRGASLVADNIVLRRLQSKAAVSPEAAEAYAARYEQFRNENLLPEIVDNSSWEWWLDIMDIAPEIAAVATLKTPAALTAVSGLSAVRQDPTQEAPKSTADQVFDGVTAGVSMLLPGLFFGALNFAGKVTPSVGTRAMAGKLFTQFRAKLAPLGRLFGRNQVLTPQQSAMAAGEDIISSAMAGSRTTLLGANGAVGPAMNPAQLEAAGRIRESALEGLAQARGYLAKQGAKPQEIDALMAGLGKRTASEVYDDALAVVTQSQVVAEGTRRVVVDPARLQVGLDSLRLSAPGKGGWAGVFGRAAGESIETAQALASLFPKIPDLTPQLSRQLIAVAQQGGLRGKQLVKAVEEIVEQAPPPGVTHQAWRSIVLARINNITRNLTNASPRPIRSTTTAAVAEQAPDYAGAPLEAFFGRFSEEEANAVPEEGR